MTCREFMGATVCMPTLVETRRIVKLCPSEKRRRRMIAKYYAWYAPLITCCGCGEQWSDGERLPRDRKRCKADAQKEWGIKR